MSVDGLTENQNDLLRVLQAALSGTAPNWAPSSWAEVLQLARLHQLDHYLYPVVSQWPAPLRPDSDMMARWRTAFFGAVADYTRAAAQAAELLGALHEAGIRVVPLKGIWLAETVYADGACRPMCDFDLLVLPEQLAAARSVFEHLGYTSPDLFLDPSTAKDVHYRHAARPMTVELHWRLWHEAKEGVVGEPDMEHVRSGWVEDRIHGVPVQSFPPERQLVYLSQHVLHHAMKMPLRAYLDILLLSRRYGAQLDANVLEKEARQWNIPFGARFVMRVVVDLFAATPPLALEAFLAETAACEAERRTALLAAVQLSAEGSRLTPAMEASCDATLFQRIRLGASRIFIPPAMIRSGYPLAVKRYGLAGGYWARVSDLFRRRGRAWCTVSTDDPGVKADLENYRTRRSLSAWIHDRDCAEGHTGGAVDGER